MSYVYLGGLSRVRDWYPSPDERAALDWLPYCLVRTVDDIVTWVDWPQDIAAIVFPIVGK